MHTTLFHKNALLPCLLLVAIITAAIAEGALSAVMIANDGGVLIVRIAEADRFAQYMINPSAPETTLLRREIVGAERRKAMGDLMLDLRTRRDAGKVAAQILKLQLSRPIAWVNSSQDGKYALVGFVNANHEGAGSAVLVNLQKDAVLSKYRPEGVVIDSAWSKTTTRIAILEMKQHTSFSPWNMFLAITGHPVEVESYFLEILDPVSGEVKRIPVAEHVLNGSAAVDWSKSAKTEN